MLNGTKLFTLRKIPVYAHWSAAIIVLLFSTSLAEEYGPIAAVVGSLGLLLSILLHEFGHAFTARRYDVQTERITLWGLGGVAQLSGQSPTPRAEGWIAAAGPITSAALAAIGMGGALGLHVLGVQGTGIQLLFGLGFLNAVLAVFNLLPGAPLDGGRILSAWRWGRHGDRYRARDEAGRAGQVVGWVIVGVGSWLVWEGVGTVFLPLTGLFVVVNAMAERKGAEAASRLDGLKVQDLTWYGVAQASADTDAETMWWQRSRLGGAGVVAITDQEGHLTGVVAEERIRKVPEQLRPMTRLAQLMVPFASIAKAEEKEPLVSALSRIHPLVPIITVWREGRLVGVVPVERVRQRLSQ